jgi:tetratricopeptide (TPR) repeat protein
MICSRRLLVVIVLFVAAAPPALAAETAKQRAAKLLDEGVAQFEEGRTAEAYASFQAAYDLFPSAKILLNMGQALKVLGRDAEAAQAYERFLVEMSALPEVGDRRVTLARAGIAEILPRIGRLRLAVQPPDALVSVDGKALGPASKLRTIYLAVGDHQVVVSSAGFVEKSVSVAATAGNFEQLDLALEALPAPLVPPVVSEAPPPPRRRWTWVAAGASAALLGAGVGFGLHVSALWDEYNTTDSPERHDALRPRIQREQTVANVLFVTAGVAAAAAGVLYFYEGRRGREVRVGLAATPGGMSGTAGWTF